ncbi:MAG TPA: hypothetical protein DDW84_04730 [Phycisphaerales bacterium]|nr:hypothetical protein [Phycisphaerales bacterium]HBR19063.1 hypothetical protein [Phycisphaerales bacterium]
MKLYVYFIVLTGLILLTVTGCCNIPYNIHPASTKNQSRCEAIMSNLAKNDPNSKLTWFDAKVIGVEGKGWTDTEGYYERVPAKAKGILTNAALNYGKHSSGLYVRFVTDSNTISARWKLRNKELSMFHMTAVGVSGLDLYVHDNNTWRLVGIGRPLQFPVNECVLAGDIIPGTYEYILYLPLYNTVEQLEIGVDPGSMFAKASKQTVKPIVFYGSSIVQGACASRPGMSHVAILGRRMNRPTINFALAGNALMEPEVADLLCELDPAVYVLDAVPNCHVGCLNANFEKFVVKIRSAHPDTPLIFFEEICYPNEFHTLQKPTQNDNITFLKLFKQLQDKGVKNIYYITSKDFIGTDGEAFVDLIHPTDLGFMRMADALEPVLKRAIKKE